MGKTFGHPKYFMKVKRLLELFATGEYPPTAFQRELTAAGILGSTSKKPMPLSSIGNMLRRPFYCGVILHKGVLHQGTHVSMISKKTFDEIQAAFTTVAKPSKRRNEKGLTFLKFATCGSCGHCITGDRHTKKSGTRYYYYRCAHRQKLKELHQDDMAASSARSSWPRK
jgi:site-specific DNA recombinase